MDYDDIADMIEELLYCDINDLEKAIFDLANKVRRLG